MNHGMCMLFNQDHAIIQVLPQKYLPIIKATTVVLYTPSMEMAPRSVEMYISIRWCTRSQFLSRSPQQHPSQMHQFHWLPQYVIQIPIMHIPFPVPSHWVRHQADDRCCTKNGVHNEKSLSTEDADYFQSAFYGH